MISDEHISQKRIEVKPLQGISIDGFKYTETKPIQIDSFSPELEDPFFVANNDLAHDLQKLLNNPRRFITEFQPLSLSQQDSSREGTRTIKGVLRSHPDKIIVLSGLGIVRFIGFPPSGFVVEPPHWREHVDKYIEMGHMQVSKEGHVWSHSNKTIFGAYDLDDLRKKLNDTQRLSASMNQSQNLEVLLAGTHSQSHNHGWMAYSLPVNAVRTTELQEIDLMQRDKVEDPGMYGQYIALLFDRMKNMHKEGIVHMELHPGNCYPVLEGNGEIDLVITDWATAQLVSDLPSDTDLSAQEYRKNGTSWGKLSARETALATDIYVALGNVLLLSNGYINKSQVQKRKFGIEVSSLAITKDMVELQLTYFAQAIVAYLEQPIDPSQFRVIIKQLLNERAIPEILDKISSIKSDWDYAGGDIDRMDKPNYLMTAAFSILAKLIAKFLASGQAEISYDLVGEL